GVARPTIGGLHDPGAPTRADDPAVAVPLEGHRPGRQLARQRAGLVVVTAQRPTRLDARRPEEDDGVADLLPAERAQRRQALRDDPQRARVVAVEEVLVAVGDD